MKISIQTSELVFAIRKRTEDELKVVLTSEADRFKLFPGTEKEDELYRAMESAKADIETTISRFLEYPDVADELSVTAPVNGVYFPDYITFDFRDSRRTSLPKQSAINTLCFETLVELTIAKFYEKVGSVDLANSHTTTATTKLTNLQNTLFQKRSPLD